MVIVLVSPDEPATVDNDAIVCSDKMFCNEVIKALLSMPLGVVKLTGVSSMISDSAFVTIIELN